MKRFFAIKRMLMTVLVLNLLDGLLTFWGLSNHWIEEANPLLNAFPPIVILGIKLTLSCLVFVLWKSNFPTRFANTWRIVLLFVIGLYSWIMFLHIIWMAMV